MDILEHFLAGIVNAANAASRPVAVTLHLCFGVTYAAHLYLHRRDWARGRNTVRALFLFPLRGGKRHAVFQCFAWLLWSLSAAITLPVYLSILAAGTDSSPPDGDTKCLQTLPNILLRALGLSQPLIPLTHVDAASGAAAVSSLWGELFLLKALLVFERGARLSDSGTGPRHGHGRGHRWHHGHAIGRHPVKHNSPVKSRRRGSRPDLLLPGQPFGEEQLASTEEAGLQGPGGEGEAEGGKAWDLRDQELSQPRRPRQQLLAPRLASLLVCLMGMALSFTGFVLLLALEHMPDTAMRVLYCCLALSCVFIGASSTHGLGGHLRYCAGAAGSAGAAVLRRSSSTGSKAAAAVAAAAAPPGGAAPASAAGEGEGDAGPGGGAGEGGEGEGGAVDVEAGEGPTWRFFQPFQGGVVFVATQAIGWTLFSSTVVAVLLLAKQLMAGVGYCMRCWALAVGALMMATQLVLGLSLLTYQQRRRARKLLQPVLHHPRASLARAAGLVMPVVMMYLPLHVVCSAVAAAFALLPARQAGAAVIAVLLPYFIITLRGHPAHSGNRRWEWLCRWFTREVEGSLAWWAGRLIVVRDFEGTAHDVADELMGRPAATATPPPVPTPATAPPPGAAPGGDAVPNTDTSPAIATGPAAAPATFTGPSSRRYVLGFHPHGLYPTGAGFLPLMPSVHAAFPGTTIVTLTASIVHYMPGLRDIAGWAGFRQVTRSTFRRALHDTGAVLLCPGGQAELVYADRAIPPRGSPGAAAAARAASNSATAGRVTATTAAAVVAAAAAEAQAAATRLKPTTTLAGPTHSEPTQPDDAAPDTPNVTAGAAAAVAAVGAVDCRTRTCSPSPSSSPCRSPAARHQLVIYAGHQGFVRLALEEGAWLVPVLALGEVLQLRNLISAPEMQRATYKRLGFPIPFILAGRWGLTALPLRNPLIYVIGRPLQPPPGWEDERQRQLQLQTAPQHLNHQSHHRDTHHQQHQQQGQGQEDENSTTADGPAGSDAAGLRRRLQPEGHGGAAAAATRKGFRRKGGRTSSSGAGTASGSGPGPGGGGGGGVVMVAQEVVDEYHGRFYAELGALWERYHHLHPVLRHAELVFEWGHHGPKRGPPLQAQAQE